MPGKHKKHTPIMSDVEQGAMGIAYSAKKGETPVSELRGPAKEMYESMPEAELKRHLEESAGKKLPHKVKKKFHKSVRPELEPIEHYHDKEIEVRR